MIQAEVNILIGIALFEALKAEPDDGWEYSFDLWEPQDVWEPDKPTDLQRARALTHLVKLGWAEMRDAAGLKQYRWKRGVKLMTPRREIIEE